MPRPCEMKTTEWNKRMMLCSEKKKKKNQMKTQWKHFVTTCKMKAICKNLGAVEQKKNH